MGKICRKSCKKLLETMKTEQSLLCWFYVSTMKKEKRENFLFLTISHYLLGVCSRHMSVQNPQKLTKKIWCLQCHEVISRDTPYYCSSTGRSLQIISKVSPKVAGSKRQQQTHRWGTSLVVKNLPCNAEDVGSIPSQRSGIPHTVERLSLRAPTRESTQPGCHD